MQAAVQIHGLKEILAACKDMDAELGDKASVGALKKVHKKVAEDVIKWAQPSMPGRLAGLIGYKASNVQKGAVIRSNADLAGSNEFGGRIPNRGSKGAGAAQAAKKQARGSEGTHLHKPKMKPSYFVYPAAISHEGEIYDYYEVEIQKLLDKKFGR